MAKITVLACVFFIVLLFKEGEPVRCWSCSSDLNPHCGDPFIHQRYDNTYGTQLRLENCDSNTGAIYPYLTSSRSACKKVVKYVNGAQIVFRGCTWKQREDQSSSCPSYADGRNEYTSFCETCDYDACNSATAVGKTLALLFAPLCLLIFK